MLSGVGVGLVGLVLATVISGGRAAPLECRPQGPILPRPNLSKSRTFQDAARQLTGILDAAAGDNEGKITIRAGWDVNSTTLSIGIISHDQPGGPGVPLWEYHHLAINTFLGSKRLNRDSQYQIGSVSKAITDAIVVRSGLNLDDPITKYITGLGGRPSLIQWDTVTLRGLASHLAGIPPNYGYSEFFHLKSYFEYLGFPRIFPKDYLMCDVFGLNTGCTRSQYVVGLKDAHPVAPPMQRPVYSNVAFTLLNYALGQATGLTYPQLLYEYLTGPLGMVNTYPSPGVFTTAAVPPVGNSWGFYFGDATPGGGLVSTLSDLSRFIYGILTYTIFNSPAAVREWLQPRSFTGSQHSFFGMPWEIYRPPPEAVFPNYNPATGDGGHTVTIYTKDGAAYGYRARVSIIDEYGIGFVLLAAGDATAVTAINDAMLHLLLPAVDKASREQVEELGYVGVFASACPIANLTVYAGNSTRWANSTTGSTSPAVNTTSTFSADIVLDGKSLVLAKLTRGNKDILAALRDIFLATYGMLVPNYRPGDILRLYPAEVSTKGTFQGRDVVREDWRMVWDVTRQVLHSDLPGQGISSYDCLAWEAVDWIYYGHEAVDRFVFIKDADTGQVIGFEAPFLREVATRDGLSCAKDAGILKRVRRNR